ncbi:MAG TPA: PDC sensor domain-containing protein [Longimicrobium sp.]|jgi:hypothetical protein|nr:PDC sensor domain-containing protein [Longimicrobium sp.]
MIPLTRFAALAAVLLAAPAAAQRGGSAFAQRLVDETVRRHPEVAAVEVTALAGEGCVTVAATDRRDVGDHCDGGERATMRSGRPDVQDPSRSDPVYDVTQALHDASGRLVGTIGMDLRPAAGPDRGAVVSRAEEIRREIEAQIPSLQHLAPGAPAPQAGLAAAAPAGPRFDPSGFAATVTNPWYPLAPGTTWRYAGTGRAASETNVITVTDETRMIQGIRAIVVRDQVFVDGRLTEDTRDWYGQDRDGNVWYLGEDSHELRDGRVVSTEGSWEAGVDGAVPGIAMWADPTAHVGEPYRQEYRRGVAEDMGKVVALHAVVTVPHGTFRNCIETEDTSPLEPSLNEHKFYCRGAGFVREIESPTEGSELVAIEKR